MMGRWMLVMVLLLPVSARAMDVVEIQGGCDAAAVRKLVRQNSDKLERCGATGQVILHVSPQGRVEHVRSDPDTRNCLQARTEGWHVQMKEATHCTLHLTTQAVATQTRANVEANAHAHPVIGMTPKAGPVAQASPAVAKVEKPAKLSAREKLAAKKAAKAAALAAKKAAKAAALAAKKAAKAAALAAKKGGKGEAVAAKKSAAASKQAERALKGKAAREARAAKLHAKHEAKAAKLAEKKAKHAEKKAQHAKAKRDKKPHGTAKPQP